MEKTGSWILILLFSLLSSLECFAGVKVTAFADRKQMGMGDSIDVVVQVSSSESVEVGEPRTPELNSFDLLNSFTSNSTTSRLAQGPRGMEFETQRLVEFHYLVTPKRHGTLTVPAFEIPVDGKMMKTVPFVIVVQGQGSGATQRPRGGGGGVLPDDGDPLDEAEQMFNQLLQRQGGTEIPESKFVPKNPNEVFFLHVDLDKTEVFEGEQITASWSIYSRGNILALDRLKFPDLKGFWKEIIEEVPALNFSQEVINGVAYRKALLASHALFPIKAGVSVVDEYKVKATVQIPQGLGFGQPYSFTRASERTTIKVKPLPTEGRPQNFSGAVGQFEVQALVDHNEVPLNQPFAMKLRFEGEGNAKLIELPSLNLPAGVEAYDTKSDAKFFKNGRSFKEFEVLLIPREPGALVLPGIEISLFDPKTGKYYIKKTEPISLKVVGEKTAAAADPGVTTKGAGAAGAKVKSEPAVPAHRLPDVVSELQMQRIPREWAWSLWGLTSLLGAGALLLKGRKELATQKKKATLKQMLRSKMKEVWKTQKSGKLRESSVQMTNVIYLVLGGISGQTGSSRELREVLALAPPSLRRDLGEALEKAVDLFQFLSFAPESALGEFQNSEKFSTELSKAEELLTKAIDHADEN